MAVDIQLRQIDAKPTRGASKRKTARRVEQFAGISAGSQTATGGMRSPFTAALGALAEGQTGATFTIRLACGQRRAKEETMIDAREHVTMTTVGAVVGAALGAAIGGAALGLPGAVAGMMLCALGGGVFGSFM